MSVNLLTSDDLDVTKVVLKTIDDKLPALDGSLLTNLPASAGETTSTILNKIGDGSKISSTYLPSYVDDVLEYANLAALPVTGETSKIYITLDTNFEYRWSGSAYIRIVASAGTLDEIADSATRVAVSPSQKAAIGTNTADIATNSAAITAINARLQTETQAYLANIITAGGKIGASSLYALDRFIVRGKSVGWFSAIKQLWIPLGDFVASKVFQITPSGITPVFNNFVSADYTQEKGYVLSTNTTKYIDTGFIPNSNGVTASNISLGACSTSDVTTNANGYIIGCTPPVNTTLPTPFFDASGSQFGNKASGSTAFAGGAIAYFGECTIALGHYGSTTYGCVLNGVENQTGTQTATTAMDSAITLFRTQRENATIYYATGGLGFYFIGTDLSNTLLIDMSKAVEDLMIATRDIYKRQPLKVFGDSILSGQGATSGPQNQQFRATKLFANWLGLREKNQTQGSGRGATTTGTYIAGLSRYSTSADENSCIVVMDYGINDATGDADVNGTTATITATGNAVNSIANAFKLANHRVIGVLPAASGALTSAKLLLYNAAIAAGYKTRTVNIVDMYYAIVDGGGAGTYTSDTTHLNTAGNTLLFEYLRYAYMGLLVRKPTLDFGSIAAQSSVDLTITVWNAVAGMEVRVTPPATLEAGLVAIAFVSANDTVTIRLTNVTASAIDPASGKFFISVATNY